MRFRILVPVLVAVVVFVGVAGGLSQVRAKTPLTHSQIAGKPALKTTADKLKATVVTPHLQRKMAPGKNVLWCSTFQIAWNELYDLSGGPIKLKPASAMADILNKRTASKADLDEASYVAGVGVNGKQLVGKIRQELARKFHGQESPELLNSIPPDLVLAYAYLFKQLPFKVAFTRFRNGMDFQGRRVEGFGIAQYDQQDATEAAMARQVVVLDYRQGSSRNHTTPEFIVELRTQSRQDRLILAQVSPGKTIGETIREVKARMVATKPTTMPEMADLRVPVLNFDILSSYGELTGRNIVSKNKALNGTNIAGALQSCRFRLDETGAIVKSEAAMFKLAASEDLTFNKPFLVLLQRKDAKNPYFALWVDNPELLVAKK